MGEAGGRHDDTNKGMVREADTTELTRACQHGEGGSTDALHHCACIIDEQIHICCNPSHTTNDIARLCS